MIITGHGPVIDVNPKEAIKKYIQWSTLSKKENKSVIIPYVSAYGYTYRIAEAVKEGIEKNTSISVEMYNMVETKVEDIFDKLVQADGILLGSPTIVRDALKPIWEVVSSMTSAQFSGKLSGAFGSYGWSGEAVPHLSERLKQLKMKVVDGLTIKFQPDEEKLELSRAFGEHFAQQLVEK